MKVLIIPEDPTLDRHVLKPVVERIFKDLDRSARVEVLREPHLRGVGQALDKDQVDEIIDDNRMIDLFVLAVDRDCNRWRNEEKAAARCAEHPDTLVAVLAREETEVWALAPHRAELEVGWSEVLASCDPKEAYFDPFVKAKGWAGTVGKGRKRAMRNFGSVWTGMKAVCPEIQKLADDIRQWLTTRPA